MPAVTACPVRIDVYQAGRPTEFWMLVDDRTGREVGSYVPATRSCRVGPDLHAGVSGDRVKELAAEHLETLAGSDRWPARAGGDRFFADL